MTENHAQPEAQAEQTQPSSERALSMADHCLREGTIEMADAWMRLADRLHAWGF